MQAGRLHRVGQGLQVGTQPGESVAFGRQVHGIAVLAAGQQAFRREAVPAGLHAVLQGLRVGGALRPGLEHAQPFFAFLEAQLSAIPAVLLGRELRLDPAQQLLGPLGPAGLEGLQLRLPRGLRSGQHLRQRATLTLGQGHGHEGLHVGVERSHIGPDAQHLRQLRRGHGVELLAPVVLHGMQAQRGFVTHQLLVKQVAAAQRVFAQHALAPGVDGVDGRVVHGLRG